MVDKFKATVEGKEVPIEIVGKKEKRKTQTRKNFSIKQLKASFIITGIMLIGVIIMAISLFVWALPVLLPLLLIGLIVRWFKQNG